MRALRRRARLPAGIQPCWHVWRSACEVGKRGRRRGCGRCDGDRYGCRQRRGRCGGVASLNCDDCGRQGGDDPADDSGADEQRPTAPTTTRRRAGRLRGVSRHRRWAAAVLCRHQRGCGSSAQPIHSLLASLECRDSVAVCRVERLVGLRRASAANSRWCLRPGRASGWYLAAICDSKVLAAWAYRSLARRTPRLPRGVGLHGRVGDVHTLRDDALGGGCRCEQRVGGLPCAAGLSVGFCDGQGCGRWRRPGGLGDCRGCRCRGVRGLGACGCEA